ncbi:DNA recombination and repair protein Rad51 C-terminal [Penicillium robsamsonii]|uniref:DNA recombination and repair protein Rad51 C-terminal n=1 Tax=Penicillium robsamsonii TaxID=1792511 RepID=UPI002546F2D0|nr:DNA recombination and repair protein Rad51 C-terminal [Penicillium robsamsonii]KAJ5816049.1 DNA recombination and repair protein Rad51 C-terminal [Penicillium robsamsonii]
MDLLLVLPGFVTKTFAHILPPLERAKVTTVDLITLDSLEIAKRARVPPADVRRLSSRIVEALHTDVGFEKSQADTGTSDGPSSSINPDVASRTIGSTKRTSQWNTISTLDPGMDALLGGGIPTGYVTEITGERSYEPDRHNLTCGSMSSGSGKTQFLLSLCLAVQLPKPQGLQQRAIYISTEHPLSTPRLSQLLECHPILSTLPAEQAPSLQNILSINAMDLETQDHILNFHLPVAIERYNIGLVIIDSVTSNYRAEQPSNSIQALTKRSSQLAKLGHLLRNLAVKEDIAIVLANQVSERFEPIKSSEPTPRSGSSIPSQTTDRGSGPISPLPKSRTEQLATRNSQQPPSSSAISSSPYHAPNDKNFDGSYLIAPRVRNSMLNVDHQERFYSGWGDGAYPESGSLKNPALGFVWSTQIACRIALKKKESHAVGVSVDDDAYMASTQETSQSQNGGNVNTYRDPDSIAMPAPSLKKRVSDSQNHQPIPGPESTIRRTMKLVFSPWTAGPKDTPRNGQPSRRSGEVEFEIWKGGLRSVSHGD